MFPNELIIGFVQVGIGLPDPLDLLDLSGRKLVGWVQTPAPWEQSLLPQNFVNARQAAVIFMLRIKDRRIHIGDLLRRDQEGAGDRTGLGLDRIQQRDRRPGAHRPVSEKTADDAGAPAAELESCHEIGNDAVVVPGIESDVRGASAVDDRAHYVLSLIAVEWRNLDGDNI